MSLEVDMAVDLKKYLKVRKGYLEEAFANSVIS
jgi:hypothetical protein